MGHQLRLRAMTCAVLLEACVLQPPRYVQEFVTNPKRVESRIIAVYDSERELNNSPEASALRVYLESEKVELRASQGPTVATMYNV